MYLLYITIRVLRYIIPKMYSLSKGNPNKYGRFFAFWSGYNKPWYSRVSSPPHINTRLMETRIVEGFNR